MTPFQSIIDAAQDKKADSISLYQFEGSALADCQIVISARNIPHVRALADAIDKALTQTDSFRVSGKPDDGWVILDAGRLIIHIQIQELREFYQLDALFEKTSQATHWRS